MSSVDQAMARRLIEARELSKLDITTAAGRLGIPYSTYKNYEDGHRGFVRHARKLSAFFKVDLVWLISGIGQPRQKSNTHPVVELFEAIPLEKQPLALEYLAFLTASKP